MTDTQSFFTVKSLLTLGGASLAVVAVGKTIRTLLGWQSPWPAFIVSVAVCFIGAYSSKALNEPLDYLVSTLNSCLLFCTALGMNETTATRKRLRSRTVTDSTESGKIEWWSSWLR